MKRICLAAIVAAAFAASSDAENHQMVQVSTHGNWMVYHHPDDKTKACGVASEKVEPVSYRRDGQPVSPNRVDRGEVRVYVDIMPSSPDQHYVAFESGYPYQQNSAVEVAITGTGGFRVEFNFVPDSSNADNHWAWPRPGEDDAVVDAMKKGGTMRIKGMSARPTETVDSISLIGVTKALEVAREICSASSLTS